jgi:hypothetical protein
MPLSTRAPKDKERQDLYDQACCCYVVLQLVHARLFPSSFFSVGGLCRGHDAVLSSVCKSCTLEQLPALFFMSL